MAADYKKLKEGIASAIKSNGAGEITGDILQEQMLNVVDTLNAGKAEAADLADIEAEAESLAKNGYREIVLVGINLTSYGRETGLSICDAVAAAATIGVVGNEGKLIKKSRFENG